MKAKLSLPLLILAASALCLGGDAEPKAPRQQQLGESVVLIGEEPAALAYLPARGQPLLVRTNELPEAGTVFVEGRDFLVDVDAGTLRRTPNSRLPDFRTNSLYGRDSFDHTQFPGFGNRGYFAFVDYWYNPSTSWPVQEGQTRFLPSTRYKLEGGQPVRIVAYGDSITAGGDASRPELIFWQRWADALQRKYPRTPIRAMNRATGGDSTVQGLERLEAKVLSEKPDLVLIGFGMNDHNVGSVSAPQFQENLKQMIDRIRGATAAEIVLFSAFPPNPKWKFGTHRMAQYAEATERVARETACAYADVFGNWQAIAARKKPEDLLGNNINHPNDFGHWIYFRVLEELGL